MHRQPAPASPSTAPTSGAPSPPTSASRNPRSRPPPRRRRSPRSMRRWRPVSCRRPPGSDSRPGSKRPMPMAASCSPAGSGRSRRRAGGAPARVVRDGVTAAAKALGMTPAELGADLRAGKSLKEVADSQGRPVRDRHGRGPRGGEGGPRCGRHGRHDQAGPRRPDPRTARAQPGRRPAPRRAPVHIAVAKRRREPVERLLTVDLGRGTVVVSSSHRFRVVAIDPTVSHPRWYFGHQRFFGVSQSTCIPHDGFWAPPAFSRCSSTSCRSRPSRSWPSPAPACRPPSRTR